jgi:site-specific DNA-methyltransferase (adenine-specific)
MGDCKVFFGDNLGVLKSLPAGSVQLVYIDPPFNTGKTQQKTSISTSAVTSGDRTGFGGKQYETTVLSKMRYGDAFDDYLGFLEPRLVELWRVLADDGCLFVHLDYREVHYVKVLMDALFGREKFINEIIWSYDFGGRSKRRWSGKHDTILYYVKDENNYTFNFDEIDRIPYLAPGLVGAEKAERGKTPTDVWWNTIVPTNGKEKTGYPTQKPLGIINRVILIHSNPGDTVLDAFAGSGTLGESALRYGRDCILIDENKEAIDVIERRLAEWNPEVCNA